MDGFVRVEGECVCPPGRQLEGDSCLPCPIDYYSDTYDLGACKLCIEWASDSITDNVGANSTSQCICEKDLYEPAASGERSEQPDLSPSNLFERAESEAASPSVSQQPVRHTAFSVASFCVQLRRTCSLS